jgi:hypothetical protein
MPPALVIGLGDRSAKLEKIAWAHAAHTNADTFERID